MFSSPFLEGRERLPELPVDSDDFLQLLGSLGIELDPLQEPVAQLTAHARDNWMLPEDLRRNPATELPYNQVPTHEFFQRAGTVDAIQPHRDTYNYILVDGNVKPLVEYRLRYLKTLMDQGLETQELTLFGGQRLQWGADNSIERLEVIAHDLHKSVEPWAGRWLEHQLEKDNEASNRWERPFATEHEIGILTLMQVYGGELEHAQTKYRQKPTSIDPSIPDAHVFSEVFSVRDKTVQVLNAPAIPRRLLGHELPQQAARPTGQSCFREWLASNKPEIGGSVLLITHNPDVYRSWFDMLLVAHKANRSDLVLEGAGDAVVQGSPYGRLLHSLGKLLVNYHVSKYGTY